MSDKLRDKMSRYEVAAPQDAWTEIVRRLDADASIEPLAEKLRGYQATPPAGTWKRIAIHLRQTQSITSRTINRRVLAAASIAAVVMIAGWWLLTGTNTRSLADRASALAADSATRRLNASTESSSPQRSAGPGHTTDFMPITIADLQKNDYLVVPAPDGQLTRISCKLAALIGYLPGNDNDSTLAFHQVLDKNAAWKKRFEEWRGMILKSGYIPASANFFDIIAFGDLLQENK